MKANTLDFFQKKYSKMFANSKMFRIFAAELYNAKVNSSVYCDGDFLSAYIESSIGLLNLSGSRCKTTIDRLKTRFSGLFLFFKTLSFRQMRRSEENATSANNSTTASRVAHATRLPIKTPRLNLTGVRFNAYLYSLRKAFREFITEETRGYCCTELRLTKKIEAARLLFPEDRGKLHQSLTNKHVQP